MPGLLDLAFKKEIKLLIAVADGSNPWHKPIRLPYFYRYHQIMRWTPLLLLLLMDFIYCESVLSSNKKQIRRTPWLLMQYFFILLFFFENNLKKQQPVQLLFYLTQYYKCSCSSNYICFNTKVTAAFVLLCNVIVDVVKPTFHVLFNKLKNYFL
jgi:hypothetical protein